MVDKPKSLAAKQQTTAATDKLPTKSMVRRSSADRLKLATGLNGAPHMNSVDKAAKAFATFNLSRHGRNAVPPNYIDRHKVNVKDPAAVHGVQRALSSAGRFENLPGSMSAIPG